eukprot:TRINITY_DN3299_c0_g1_i4.p1 TRINITY_DN3299_c0_g1~~TRINITY_DN3299_c0_g1_i4.p1  ORF type:complete len:4166 (+),score=1072.85 TRINITY_DN3299_c0_g1_i4:109-12606(+)
MPTWLNRTFGGPDTSREKKESREVASKVSKVPASSRSAADGEKSAEWEVTWSAKYKRWYFQDRSRNFPSSWTRPEGCNLEVPAGPPAAQAASAGAASSGGEQEGEEGWESAFDATSRRVYYYNRKTGMRTWDKPGVLPPLPPPQDTQPSEVADTALEGLQRENHELAKEALASLRKENERLQEEGKKLKIQEQELVELKDELSYTRELLNAQPQAHEFDRLRRELSEARQQEEKLASVTECLATAEAEMERLRPRAQELDEWRGELADFKHMSPELEEAKRRSEALEKERSSLEEKVAEAAELKQKVAMFEVKEDKFAMMQEVVATLRRENQRLELDSLRRESRDRPRDPELEAARETAEQLRAELRRMKAESEASSNNKSQRKDADSGKSWVRKIGSNMFGKKSAKALSDKEEAESPSPTVTASAAGLQEASQLRSELDSSREDSRKLEMRIAEFEDLRCGMMSSITEREKEVAELREVVEGLRSEKSTQEVPALQLPCESQQSGSLILSESLVSPTELMNTLSSGITEKEEPPAPQTASFTTSPKEEADVASLQTENAELLSRLAEMQQTLNVKDADIMKLEEELGAMRTENEKLQDQSRNLDREKAADLMKLEEQLGAMRTENEKLQDQSRNLDREKAADLMKLEEQLGAMRTENEKLQDQSRNLDREKAADLMKLEEQLGAMRTENEKLQDQSRNLDREKDEDISKLKEELGVLRSENKKLQDQSRSLDCEKAADISKLKEELGALRIENTQLQDKNKHIEHEKDAKMSQLKEDLGALRIENEKLQDKSRHLEHGQDADLVISQLEEELGLLKGELKQLQDQARNLDNEKEVQLIVQCDARESAIESLPEEDSLISPLSSSTRYAKDADLAKLTEELGVLRNENEKLQDEVRNLEREKDADLAQLKEELDDLRSENEKLQEDYFNLDREKDADTEKYKDELGAVQKENMKLQEDSRNIELKKDANLARLREELGVLREDNGKLQDKIRNIAHEKDDEAQMRISELEAALTVLDSENQSQLQQIKDFVEHQVAIDGARRTESDELKASRDEALTKLHEQEHKSCLLLEDIARLQRENADLMKQHAQVVAMHQKEASSRVQEHDKQVAQLQQKLLALETQHPARQGVDDALIQERREADGAYPEKTEDLHSQIASLEQEVRATRRRGQEILEAQESVTASMLHEKDEQLSDLRDAQRRLEAEKQELIARLGAEEREKGAFLQKDDTAVAVDQKESDEGGNSLQDALSKLQAQKEELEITNTKLEENHQSAHAAQETKIAHLTASVARLEDKVAAEAASKIEATNAQLSKLLKMTEDKEQLEKANTELEERYRSALKAHETQAKERDEKMSQLNDTFAQEKLKFEETRDELEKRHSAQHHAQEAEIEDLKKANARLENEKQRSYDALEKQKDSAAAKALEHRNRASELLEALTRITEEKVGLEHRNSDLEERFNLSASMVETLQEQLTVKQTNDAQLSELKASVSRLSNNLVDRQTTAALATVSNEKDSLELKHRLERLTVEMESLKSRNSELEAKQESAVEEVSRLEELLEEERRKQELAALEKLSEWEQKFSKLAEELALHEAQAAALSLQVSRLEEEKKSGKELLDKMLAQASAATFKCDEEMSEMKKHNKELETLLQRKQHEHDHKVAELKADAENLQAANQALRRNRRVNFEGGVELKPYDPRSPADGGAGPPLPILKIGTRAKPETAEPPRTQARLPTTSAQAKQLSRDLEEKQSFQSADAESAPSVVAMESSRPQAEGAETGAGANCEQESAVSEVAVPDDHHPGDVFIAEVDGVDVEVTVPEGCKAGDVVTINKPSKQASESAVPQPGELATEQHIATFSEINAVVDPSLADEVEVEVPEDHYPGDVFIAEVNGIDVEVMVPEGCKPGDVISVDVTSTQPSEPLASNPAVDVDVKAFDQEICTSQDTAPVSTPLKSGREDIVEVQVPEGHWPGDVFIAEVNGVDVEVAVPERCQPGDVIAIDAPKHSGDHSASVATSNVADLSGCDELQTGLKLQGTKQAAEVANQRDSDILSILMKAKEMEAKEVKQEVQQLINQAAADAQCDTAQIRIDFSPKVKMQVQGVDFNKLDETAIQDFRQGIREQIAKAAADVPFKDVSVILSAGSIKVEADICHSPDIDFATKIAAANLDEVVVRMARELPTIHNAADGDITATAAVVEAEEKVQSAVQTLQQRYPRLTFEQGSMTVLVKVSDSCESVRGLQASIESEMSGLDGTVRVAYPLERLRMKIREAQDFTDYERRLDDEALHRVTAAIDKSAKLFSDATELCAQDDGERSAFVKLKSYPSLRLYDGKLRPEKHAVEPDVKVQPAKSLDELVQQASVAQQRLKRDFAGDAHWASQAMNTPSEIPSDDMRRTWSPAEEGVLSWPSEFLMLNATHFDPGVKQTQQVEEKLEKIQNTPNALANMTDVSRLVIIFASFAEIDKALGAMKHYFQDRIVWLDNRFRRPTVSGYADIKVGIRTHLIDQNAEHISEVHLMHKAIHEVEQGEARALYEDISNILLDCQVERKHVNDLQELILNVLSETHGDTMLNASRDLARIARNEQFHDKAGCLLLASAAISRAEAAGLDSSQIEKFLERMYRKSDKAEALASKDIIQVKVPFGYAPGDLLVTDADGAEIEVIVPMGSGPGDTLSIEPAKLAASTQPAAPVLCRATRDLVDVVVPHGCKAGDVITIYSPKAESPSTPVKVPPDHHPGDTFIVDVDGLDVEVVVPEGCTAGDAITIQADKLAALEAMPEQSRGDTITTDAPSVSKHESKLPEPSARKAQDAAREIVQVAVPEGSAPGESFIAEVNGIDYELVVPEGCKPGDVVKMELPSPSNEESKLAECTPKEQDAVREIIQVAVPEGVAPGESFIAEVNGVDLEVVVPEGSKPGNMITIGMQNEPTDNYKVKVPSGLTPGDTFTTVVSGELVEVGVPQSQKPGDFLEEAQDQANNSLGLLSVQEELKKLHGESVSKGPGLQDSVDRLQEDNSMLTQLRDENEKELSHLRCKISELQEDNGRLQDELKQSKQQSNTLQDDCERHLARIEDLVQQSMVTEGQITVLQGILEQKEPEKLQATASLLSTFGSIDANVKMMGTTEMLMQALVSEPAEGDGKPMSDAQASKEKVPEDSNSVISFGPGEEDDVATVLGDLESVPLVHSPEQRSHGQTTVLERSSEFKSQALEVPKKKLKVEARRSRSPSGPAVPPTPTCVPSPKGFVTVPRTRILAEQQEKEMLRKKLKALQRENVKLELREQDSSKLIMHEDTMTALQKENRKLKKLALAYLGRQEKFEDKPPTDEDLAAVLAGAGSATAKLYDPDGKKHASYKQKQLESSNQQRLHQKERLRQKQLYRFDADKSKADARKAQERPHSAGSIRSMQSSDVGSAKNRRATWEESLPSDDDQHCIHAGEPDSKQIGFQSAAGAAGGSHGLRKIRSTGNLEVPAENASRSLSDRPLSASTKGSLGSNMRRAMQELESDCLSQVPASPSSPSSASAFHHRSVHADTSDQLGTQDLADAARTMQAQLMRPLLETMRPPSAQQRPASKFSVQYSTRWRAAIEAEFARKRIKQGHTISASDRFGNSLLVEWSDDGCPHLKDPPDRHAFPLTFQATQTQPTTIVLEKGSRESSSLTATAAPSSPSPPSSPSVPWVEEGRKHANPSPDAELQSFFLGSGEYEEGETLAEHCAGYELAPVGDECIASNGACFYRHKASGTLICGLPMRVAPPSVPTKDLKLLFRFGSLADVQRLASGILGSPEVLFDLFCEDPGVPNSSDCRSDSKCGGFFAFTAGPDVLGSGALSQKCCLPILAEASRCTECNESTKSPRQGKGDSLVTVPDLKQALDNCAIAIEARLHAELHLVNYEGSQLCTLANVLTGQGRVDDAEALLSRAFDYNKAAVGPAHLHTALAAAALAACLDDLGRAQDAEPFHRQAVTGLTEARGKQSHEVQVAEASLAACLAAQGLDNAVPSRPPTALSSNQDLLQLEGGAAEALAMMFGGAANSEEQGQPEEAECLYRQGLGILRRVLGPFHPEALQALNNLALCLGGQGKLSQAEQLLRRAVAGMDGLLSRRHPRPMQALSNLACCLADQGRLEEAEEMHKRAFDLCKQNLGGKHPETHACAESLASFLSSCGRSTEAALTVLQADHHRSVRRTRFHDA